MRVIILAVCATLMAYATAAGGARAQTQDGAPPAWWIAHVNFMSRDGGVWVTPNPDGADDPAIPDAFGMEWRAAYGGYVLVGRLYGIEDGAEQQEYWTYREFWHPGEHRAVLEQWGGLGAYGVGETTAPDEHHGQVNQTFWLPDGRSWREGHRTIEQGDVYITNTFDIGTDGEWNPSGSYTWRRTGAN